MSAPVPTRGWKPDRGWYLRTRRRSGAESKQKFATYAEAVEAAREARLSGSVREAWVEEGQATPPMVWRDLDADRARKSFSGERAHVLSIEED